MAAEWVGVRIGNGWRREEEAAGMRAKQVLRQVEGGSGSAVRYRSRGGFDPTRTEEGGVVAVGVCCRCCWLVVDDGNEMW